MSAASDSDHCAACGGLLGDNATGGLSCRGCAARAEVERLRERVGSLMLEEPSKSAGLYAAIDELQRENEALKAERDRAVETRENANTVSVRVEGENRALRAENEALSRDYGTLDRLVQDIEQYALTPEAVLRSIEQAWRAIEDRAAVETDEERPA